MAPQIRILTSGACCTIQDRGRRGQLRNGVANSGPMDWVAFELAQILAGVPTSQPGLEISIGGIELEAVGDELRLGLAGVGFSVSIDSVRVAYPASIRLRPGQRLEIQTGHSGAWFYVLPSAKIDMDPVLGSLATHARYAIGPRGGKILRPGDEITLRGSTLPIFEYEASFPDLANNDPIRVILGPQDDLFDRADVETFLSAEFRLTSRNDRMAYVLAGPRIQPETSYDIVTDGTALGSIQVAGDGSPYVLMVDRSTTGGYPKIATIIRAEIGRFAQKRTGDKVVFASTDVESAVTALRDLKAKLDSVGNEPRTAMINLEALNRGDGAAGGCDALLFDT